MIQPDFIQIPTQLLSDPALQPSDRIVFGYIYWMTKLALMKCVAGNDVLSELTGLSERGVQLSLARLEKQGYVRRIYVGQGDRNRENIECLIAYSALKPTDERTNVRTRANKRSYASEQTFTPPTKKSTRGETVKLDSRATLPKKKIKEEYINRNDRVVFEQLKSVIQPKARYTPSYDKLIRKALSVLTEAELLTAAQYFVKQFEMKGTWHSQNVRYKTIVQFLGNDKNSIARYVTCHDAVEARDITDPKRIIW